VLGLLPTFQKAAVKALVSKEAHEDGVKPCF